MSETKGFFVFDQAHFSVFSVASSNLAAAPFYPLGINLLGFVPVIVQQHLASDICCRAFILDHCQRKVSERLIAHDESQDIMSKLLDYHRLTTSNCAPSRSKATSVVTVFGGRGSRASIFLLNN